MRSANPFRINLDTVPPDGMGLCGEVTFSQLGVADDERIICPAPLTYSLRVSIRSRTASSRMRCIFSMDFLCDSDSRDCAFTKATSAADRAALRFEYSSSFLCHSFAVFSSSVSGVPGTSPRLGTQ